VSSLIGRRVTFSSGAYNQVARNSDYGELGADSLGCSTGSFCGKEGMADSSKPGQPSVTRGDAALIVGKAALEAIPVVGGPLAALLEFVPTARDRNIIKAIEFLREQITSLETRIDTASINKEEFAELFASFTQVAVRTHHDEKLHASANILSALLLQEGDPAKVPYDELDHLIRCVDALSIGAISALGAIRKVSATHPLGPQQEAIQFGQLRTEMTIDAHFLRSLVSELQGFNLVRVQESPTRGHADAEYDGSHITISPIGRRFIEQFIEGQM
jgi:hypothetical protein